MSSLPSDPPRPGFGHLRLRRRRNVGKFLRFCVIAGTFVVSALANHAVGLHCWEAIFAALQSFTLGLDTNPDPAVMEAGGLWPTLVWTTRVLAPLVAAESVLFAALLSGVIGRPRFLLVDHVVVIGAGNLGHTVAERLIDLDGRDGSLLEVVVVDNDPLAPYLKELEEQGAWIVVGDGTLAAVLHEARVEHARAVVIATSSDVVNVAAMWNARLRCLRGAQIYVHVGDDHLRATVAATLRPGDQVELFDLYDEAGRLLVEQAGLDRPSPVPVVVAGFGRLGQAIHRHLRVDAVWSSTGTGGSCSRRVPPPTGSSMGPWSGLGSSSRSRRSSARVGAGRRWCSWPPTRTSGTSTSRSGCRSGWRRSTSRSGW